MADKDSVASFLLQDEKNMVDCYGRTCSMARKTWVQMGLA